MAVILLIAIGVLVIVGVIATIVQVARDGYHPTPTRRDLVRRP